MSAGQLPDTYRRRVIDNQLDELLDGLPAVAIDGPKAVGKSRTASRRAVTEYRLDDEAVRQRIIADPTRLISSDEPILIDEWQLYPYSWDAVRRAVDADPRPARFILTGSTSLKNPQTHSGAGRIVSLRMRPLTLPERGVVVPTVSFDSLLNGPAPAPIDGESTVGLERYVEQIIGGGFPGMQHTRPDLRADQFDSYLQRIIDRDFPEAGHQLRNPAGLRRWLTAFAAATATTATFETIRDAAATGHSNPPARSTTIPYRDTLESIWISDPVPAWSPVGIKIDRLTEGPKHHLTDPALAAAVLGADAHDLLSGLQIGPALTRDGDLLGQLFESLVALSLRVFAQAARGDVHHLRTKNTQHEVDFIVTGRKHRTVAVEVKLAATVDPKDVRHLKWLKEQMPDLTDAMIVNTGKYAYRRPDGIAVVPLALLGP